MEDCHLFENAKPYLVIIQATPFCNIDCRYCYLPAKLSKDRISFDTLRQIYFQLFAAKLMSGKPSIVWHAGEPLTLPVEFYSRAIDILNEENKEGLAIENHIQTNATLINQEWCNLFRSRQVKIGVSLDGPEHVHDKNRVDRHGKGTFAKTMRGVRLLQENGIEFSVIMVLSRYALGYPEEIFRFFVDNGINNFAFNVEEQEGVNTVSSMRHQYSSLEYEDFFRKISRLHTDYPHVRIRELDHVQKAIFHSNYMRSETSLPLQIVNFDCKGNYSTFCPELLTMTHPRYGDFVFGNVWTEPIDDIWQNEKFIRVSGEIKRGVDKCRQECEYFFACGGGKPVNKLCENNSFESTVTDYCRFRVMSLVDVVLDELEKKHHIHEQELHS